MNTQMLSSLDAVAFDAPGRHGDRRRVAPRAGRAPAADALDFAGRSVYLDGAPVGPIVAWYFAVTPRRDATIIALGRNAWQGDRPDAAHQAHAAALIEQGVSVLLVDVRRCERWSARWTGCTAERFIGSALQYLAERGHDIEEIQVVHGR